MLCQKNRVRLSVTTLECRDCPTALADPTTALNTFIGTIQQLAHATTYVESTRRTLQGGEINAALATLETDALAGSNNRLCPDVNALAQAAKAEVQAANAQGGGRTLLSSPLVHRDLAAAETAENTYGSAEAAFTQFENELSAALAEQRQTKASTPSVVPSSPAATTPSPIYNSLIPSYSNSLTVLDNPFDGEYQAALDGLFGYQDDLYGYPAPGPFDM